ncbi:MAG: hypothetical protein HKN25_12475 [Pyrinomonadaceae bacterium]|nr:hypothetical protein [Pyrinomonadaceae bacterium]
MKNGLFIVVVLIILSQSLYSQKNGSPAAKLPTGNEPSPSHPYGRLNPNAPAETAQFSFMIGEFDCDDKILDQNGKWTERKVVWNSTYFLNGSGIQDRFWSYPTVASGTRIFDKKKGKWIVNYFQTAPTYFAGVWEGKKEGDKMVMRAPRGENESRLTFHNIKDDGFDWIGETVSKDGKANPFWIISCKRRR